MDILGILGGLLGSSVTGGSKLGSLVGSALGSKLGGRSTKDAIKNALLQSVTGSPGAGGDFSSVLQQAALQGALGGGGDRDSSGILALMALQGMGGGSTDNPLAALFGGGMGGGAAPDGQGGGGLNPQMLFSGLGSLALLEALSGPEQVFKEQYASRYTGLRYNTPEERDAAERMYEEKLGYSAFEGPRGYAQGGYIDGPGTGTSDSIRAMIYQNGTPVQEARLSDGEFVMTERAVRGAGDGDRGAGAARMYRMMREFERGAA